MKVRKIVTLLLALAMIFALAAGCSDNNPSGTNSDPGTQTSNPGNPGSQPGGPAQNPGEMDKTVYVSIADGDVGTLDPFNTNDAARKQVLLQFYETLFNYDVDGNLVGVLAKDYKRDGRVYTIELWDNIHDAKGNPFTADDVVWCLDTYKEKVTSGEIYSFESWKKIDDTHVEMTVIDNGVTTFYGAIPGLWMVTQEAYEASGNNMSVDNVVTTAHYQVQDYTTGSTLTLTKNENYWQDDDKITCIVQEANVDTIVYNFLTEASQIVVGLEDGKLDVAFVDQNLADRFREGGASADGFIARDQATWGGKDLWLNESDSSIFKDNIWLRRAIFHAVDRAAIVEAAWNGHATIGKTYGSLRYPDVDPALADRDYFEYDPEYALECLERAGYQYGELKLSLLYPSNSYDDTMCTVIAAYLENNLGIEVEINGLENAIFNSYYMEPDKWDLLIQGGGGSGSVTQVWGKRLNRNAFGGEYCLGFVNDDTLQSLVETASDVNTNGYETTTAVHDYLVDQAYVMRLYIEEKCCVFNSDKIVDMCVNVDMRPVPGASTYVWN